MKSEWAFDRSEYHALNAPRENVVREIVAGLKHTLELKTAIDVGCGVGHFSSFLQSLGLKVLGVDARQENIDEARRRFPGISFEVINAEEPRLRQLGTFDLVLCFGLLYHLENPFQAIRQLSALSAKISLLEGICYPSPEPVMVLIDEDELGDQGVHYIAFYPSEACLLKMLYRSGFSSCFFPREMPLHPYYQPGKNKFRHRTMIAASKVPVSLGLLIPQPETKSDLRSWNLKPMYALGARTDRMFQLVQRLLDFGRVAR